MTDVELRGLHLKSVIFLGQFVDRRPDEGVEAQLLRTLAARGEATFEALLAAACWAPENCIKALAPMWRLLARQQIEADLIGEPTMQTPIWLPGHGHLP